MILLRDVSFTFPQSSEPALRNVNLEIPEGSFTLVVGATGSGKSTLLRTLNGLVPWHSGGIRSGEAFVDSRPVADPRSLADTVGFVPQDPASHSVATTVSAELGFVLENLSVEPRLRAKRISETMDAIGIGHLAKRRLETLSGGERQRVAIAAVMVAVPKVLVLDEPTSSLDPQSAQDVVSVLTHLRDEFSTTIVLAEHRLDRVLSAATHLAILDDGACRFGPKLELLSSLESAPPTVQLGRRLPDPLALISVADARRHARFFEYRGCENHGSASEVRGSDGQPVGTRPIVDTRRISVAFNSTKVLSDVDLTLHRGVTTAMVGRTGSGKTTLFKAIAGLVKNQNGTVVIDGLSTKAKPSSSVSFLPQSAEALLYRNTVASELREADTTVWLNRVGLTSRADDHPWDLSSGQRLRLALAVVFSREAPVYLLDEPTRGLDESGRKLLRELIEEKTRQGCAVGLITHDVELIATVAGRVAMLSNGSIIAEGLTTEILGESLMFSTQTQKVMADRRCLTPDDVALRDRAVAGATSR